MRMIRNVAIGTMLLAGAGALFIQIGPTNALQSNESRLLSNCKSFNWRESPDVIASIDVENSMVMVRRSSTSVSEHVIEEQVVLPLKSTMSTTQFANCSRGAQKLLKGLQLQYDGYIAESCADFRDVVQGRKPLPARNGKKANIDGARKFLAQFCR